MKLFIHFFLRLGRILRVKIKIIMNAIEFSIAASQPSMSGNRPTFVGDGFLTTRDFGEFNRSFSDRFNRSLNNLTPRNIKNFHYTIWRAHYYEFFALESLRLDGDLMEMGVWYGLFANTVCQSKEFQSCGKNFHLIDAFGFDCFDTQSHGFVREKYKPDIYEAVKSRFKDLSVVFHRGIIPDILEANIDKLPEKICFLSMDLNNAQSERAGIEFVWNRLVPELLYTLMITEQMATKIQELFMTILPGSITAIS